MLLASDMVNRYGFTPLGLSVRSKDTSASQRAIDTLLADAHMRATSLLNEHAGLLETVAQSLLEYQRLDRDELRALYTAFLHDVRSPIETDTVRQETGVFKESALVGSAARRHQERRPVVVKRSKAGLARRLVRRLSFRRRRLRAL